MLTSATAPYVVALIAGLLLGVAAMLMGTHGVRNEALRPTYRSYYPILAAFGVTFGLTGYLLVREGTFSGLGPFSLALLSAVLVTALVWFSVTRWVLPTHVQIAEDAPEEIQGQVGYVTADITSDGLGRIQYQISGKDCSVPARSIDGSLLLAGTEVIIERIDEGIATVEAWSSVEQRL